MSAKAYEALAARLRRSVGTSDANLVLSDNALCEAEELLDADPEELAEHPAWVVAVGTLHWLRFQVLSAREFGEPEVELRDAFLLFEPLRGVVPDWIP